MAMTVNGLVRRLLEEPKDDPLEISLEPYVGPIQFDQNVRHILERAKLLKKQAQDAGALAIVRRQVMAQGSKTLEMDIDRAMLAIAVEQHNSEMAGPAKIAQLLKRHMHFIWD